MDRKVNKRIVTKIRVQGSEVKYLHKPFNHGCKLLMDSKLPRIYIWLVMRETNIYNKRNLDNWLIFSGDNVSGATSWSMHKTSLTFLARFLKGSTLFKLISSLWRQPTLSVTKILVSFLQQPGQDNTSLSGLPSVHVHVLVTKYMNGKINYKLKSL